jgi:hypothetical protein
MKTLITIISILISINSLYAQQASDYFPSQTGFLWNYAVTPLDSLNNPINDLTVFRRDSFNVVTDYQGKAANVVTSKTGPLQTIYFQPYTDSLFFNTTGSDGFEYFSISNIEGFLVSLDSMGLDTNFNFVDFFSSLQNWYSVYRFGANVGSKYILLSIDTTVATYQLRFQYSATRQDDENIQTVIGNLSCKKFLIEWTIFTLLGPFPIPIELINLPVNIWVAPGNWIVQDIIPTQNIDLSVLGIPPFSIPGRQILLTDQITSVESEENIPVNFVLNQNYPNPFNPTTTISWQSSFEGQHTLKVYDILGNEIATIVNEYKPAGKYEIEFNSQSGNRREMSSGIYFYQLKSGDMTQTRKMILLK